MLKIGNKKLYFGGQDISTLAKKHQPPFFLFSQAILEQNYQEFVQYFSTSYKNIRVDYSVKTNSELKILMILKTLGSCLEVASGHELFLAKKAGFQARKIVYDGPCKTDQDIAFALEAGIHAFYVDSWPDFLNIARLAKKLKKKFKIVFRINLGLKDILANPAEKAIDKFGIKSSQVLDYCFKLSEYKNANFLGLSTHLGSQHLKPDPYIKAVDRLAKLSLVLKKNRFLVQEVNLGGGYPSQTLLKTTLPALLLSTFGINLKQKATPLPVFGKRISSRFQKQFNQFSPKPVLAFQPGRALVSSMGVAVTSVKVIKDKWVFLDISTASLPESLFFAQREIIPVVQKDGRIKTYNFAGAGLVTADNFAFNLKLPQLSVKDLVVILDAGAYSISRANRFTVLNPAVYLINKTGKIKKIRRGEVYEDIIAPMQQ